MVLERVSRPHLRACNVRVILKRGIREGLDSVVGCAWFSQDRCKSEKLSLQL